MNPDSQRHQSFALCREMLELPGIVRRFDPAVMQPFIEAGRPLARVLLTGEGSSRIFPAKHAIWRQLQSGLPPATSTEGATQALEYPLGDSLVVGCSNSGRTKELVRLFLRLRELGHPAVFAITAGRDSPVEHLSRHTRVLACGPEQAVAATKSVVEQALCLDVLLAGLRGQTPDRDWFAELADRLDAVLAQPLPDAMVRACAAAGRIHFAGRNNGVAEELALKTNEIIRKRSSYLEGTYALHGIEEVMDKDDLVLVIDPWEAEEEKFDTCLAKGVGMPVLAIAGRPTRFPTLEVPQAARAGMEAYLQLAAGWNLLVETGLALDIPLDSPRRARKIGNAC
jgi:glucosamine--fructose-6-phosphate aminotransferase (isomerizing)